MILVYIIIGLLLGSLIVTISKRSEEALRQERLQSKKSWLEKQRLQIRRCRKEINDSLNVSAKSTAELKILNKALHQKDYDLEDLNDLTKEIHQYYREKFSERELNYKSNYGEHIKVELSPLAFVNLGIYINETIHNVITHAGSTFCFNIFTKEENETHLITHDNGSGFDYKSQPTNEDSGLARIHHMKKTLNADFHVSSVKGVGTKTTLKLKKKRIGF